MRVDGVIGGQILYWEMNPQTMLRSELKFKKPFSELQKMAAYSEIVQRQFLYSGFYTKSGEEISEERVDELVKLDPQGFTDFAANLTKELTPPKEAPLLSNSSNGAKSDIAPKATGRSRTGKSARQLKGE